MRNPSAGGLRGRCARAFTIIEVLIVLALLIAIGALSIPPVWRWVEDYRFRESLARFDSAMDSCRAVAQRRGEVLAVSAAEVNGIVRVESRGVARRPVDELEVELVESGAEEPATLRFRFPRGFRLAVDEGGSAGFVPGAGESDETQAAGREFALLLPDGTAASGDRLLVTDVHGRRAEVAVDRWSGEVRLREVNRAGAPDASEQP